MDQFIIEIFKMDQFFLMVQYYRYEPILTDNGQKPIGSYCNLAKWNLRN